MNRRIPFLPPALCLATACALALPAARLGAQQPLPTLAVIDLQDGGSIGPDAQDLSQLGRGLGSMLTTEMMRSPRVRLAERGEIQRLLAEQKLTLSGLVDAETAVRVGRLVGARYVLLGSYTDVYSTLRVDVRVVDVETSQVIRAYELTDKRESLFRMVRMMVDGLLSDLDLQAPAGLPSTPPVPAKAVLLFSRGLEMEDRGDVAGARRMYEEALRVFPQYADASQHLQKLGGGR